MEGGTDRVSRGGGEVVVGVTERVCTGIAYQDVLPIAASVAPG